jgi:hypothetical protein
MNIQKATRQYEDWLATFTPLIQHDIALKHKEMASGPFPFLRATFYRWVQVWPNVCRDLCSAPAVLSVGDLHIENFGLWRDSEGRLVWGVNDFDEAGYLPYTNDLSRLAASALLAIEADRLSVGRDTACDSILAGYTAGLKAKGRPFVLAESHEWLRKIAVGVLREPGPYWKKLDGLAAVTEIVPESAVVALEHIMPRPAPAYTIKHRIAGLGSLGRPRYVALAQWSGGWIARETKALVPASMAWARQANASAEIFYQAIIERAVRCRDPFVQLQGHWIVRRLAPDCSRIELASLTEENMETDLLRAMGWETANVHLGSATAVAAIRRDLTKRKKGWLLGASEGMLEATMSDWRAWARNK